jgi:hypothetical protein
VRRIIFVFTTVLIAIGVTAFVALGSTPGNRNSDSVWTVVLKAREGTEKYQDVRQALKDGYVRDSPCVQDTSLGAMGIHYLNAKYAADPSIKAGKPELLLYFPQPSGGLRLVAVEYFRPDADQDLATTEDRPSLAGVPFDGPMEGHNPIMPKNYDLHAWVWNEGQKPLMPKHYDLHAWVWNWNPSGVFSQFNPNLHCPGS